MEEIKQLKDEDDSKKNLVEMKNSFEFDGSFDPDVSRDEALAALESQKQSALSKFIMRSPHKSERAKGLEEFTDLMSKKES